MPRARCVTSTSGTPGSSWGRSSEAAETYTVVGNMNEHQVSIGETTWGGRSELQDPKAIVDYGSLMYIALQRAKTAREAIEVMTGLVAEYGYASSGETFSIADPDEVWILDMIGKGPDDKGAVWVARRVPDGYISAHANAARIRQFPLNDRQNTLYAPDVISFARDKGWFDGRDEDFSFADIYNPPDYGAVRFCDARVWCMYNRARPVRSDLRRLGEGRRRRRAAALVDQAGQEALGRRRHRLHARPLRGHRARHDARTSAPVPTICRTAGGRSPGRWTTSSTSTNVRPRRSRPASRSSPRRGRGSPTPSAACCGSASTTPTAPSTSRSTAASHACRRASPWAPARSDDFTWDSAFWVFNWVSNYAYLRYSEMIQDIQVVQRELEGGFIAALPEVDAAAVALHAQAPRLAKDYLTDYSCRTGDAVVARWRKLGESLLYKYLDGNTKNELGEVQHPGYPESWYRKVAAATGDRLQMVQLSTEKQAAEAAEAKKKEQARSLVQGILTLLASRNIEVDGEARAKIESTQDLTQLEDWLVRAATAPSVGKVLAAD